MGWEAQARKIYEARVIADSLARLAQRLDVGTLPFSKEELDTLARRARESFRKRNRERLDRYAAHLSGLHGAEVVSRVLAALEEINNEIGYEEK